MRYFIWIYCANIINRLRWLGLNIGRLSMFVLLLGYLSLAQPSKPVYFAVVYHYINLTWWVFGLSFIFTLIPSEKFILSMLSVYRRDNFMRYSIFAKIARLVKYFLLQDVFKRNFSKGLYNKLVNDKRVKLFCWLLYFYDVYKGFGFILRFIWELVTLYFGFILATYAYVYLTNAQLYYYSVVQYGSEWFWAISSFIIFKILFVPNFSTIRRIIGRIIMGIIKDRFGVNKFEHQIDNKLEEYETRGNL